MPLFQLLSSLPRRFSVLRHFSSMPPPLASMAVNRPKDEEYLRIVIPKRIQLFESIQAQQLTHSQSFPADPIKITLPDGTVKEGKKWVTSPMDVAREISKSLAANALISQVNGVLWDMTRPLEGDCELKLFTFYSDEGRDTFWHSSAHILGQALEQEYGCKLCIGSCTTRGEGFYYDAFYGDLGLNDEYFKQIESGSMKAVTDKQPFECIEVLKDEALQMFSDNNFKIEIINDLPVDKTITVYRCGPLVDLCRGPHIPNTSFVKAFACLKASSAYWRGNKDRESLQRVYGISCLDKKCLQEYIKQLEEAKKYDHRLVDKTRAFLLSSTQEVGSSFLMALGYTTNYWSSYAVNIGKEGTERSYHQMCTICNFGKHLVMLQITRIICLYLR